MLVIIEFLHAQKILNSMGEWTIEVNINGYSASVPSGTSRGSNEVKIFSADKAVNIVNKKLQVLCGTEISQVDKKLKRIDGTSNFSKIGGNTAIGTSLAAYKATLPHLGNIFPYPLGNVYGGGLHKGFIDIQEILLIPLKAKTIVEAIETNAQIYKRLKDHLNKKRKSISTNYENALISNLEQEEALDIICDIANDFKTRVGLDIAATQMWNGKVYKYKHLKKELKQNEQIDFVLDLIKKYKLVYVEDPLHEDDFDGFSELTKKSKKCLICGDDLFVTNFKRLKEGINKRSGNSIIIKPNQVGTVSDAFETVQLAKEHKYIPVISHRSGETTDFVIADMALDWDIPLIKTGVTGDVRLAKLIRLVELWEKTRNPKMAKVM